MSVQVYNTCTQIRAEAFETGYHASEWQLTVFRYIFPCCFVSILSSSTKACVIDIRSTVIVGIYVLVSVWSQRYIYGREKNGQLQP